MKTKTMPTDYEQKIKLSQIKGLEFKIAQAMIKEHGFYSCIFNDKKTVVVK